jgi:hypothetical protein
VLLLLLLAAPLPSRAGSNHSVVSLTLRGPASTTAPNFLGVNIDTASLYQGYDPHRLDFADSGFVELGAAFAAAGAVDGRTTLRIGGGSTADDSGWGAAAPGNPHQPSPGSGPHYSQHVVIDEAYYPTACACCAGESIVEEVSTWMHWDRNFGALDSMDSYNEDASVLHIPVAPYTCNICKFTLCHCASPCRCVAAGCCVDNCPSSVSPAGSVALTAGDALRGPPRSHRRCVVWLTADGGAPRR